MEGLFVAGITFLGSGSYLVYQGIKFKEYHDFKRFGFRQNLRILAGQITCEDLSINPKWSNNFIIKNNTFHETNEINGFEALIKSFSIEEGRQKTRTEINHISIPGPKGKPQFIPVSEKVKYVEFKEIYNKTFWQPNLKILNINLDLNQSKILTGKYSLKLYPMQALNILKQIDPMLPLHPKANKYIFHQQLIVNKENVTVVGELINKNMIVKAIGDKEAIHKFIRSNVVKVHPYGIFAATTLCLGSSIFMMMNPL